LAEYDPTRLDIVRALDIEDATSGIERMLEHGPR
jgi:hypothetical protein